MHMNGELNFLSMRSAKIPECFPTLNSAVVHKDLKESGVLESMWQRIISGFQSQASSDKDMPPRAGPDSLSKAEI